MMVDCKCHIQSGSYFRWYALESTSIVCIVRSFRQARKLISDGIMG
jgi:hypothetical protein